MRRILTSLLVYQLAFALTAASSSEGASARRHKGPTAFSQSVKPFDLVEQFAPMPFDLEAVRAEDRRRESRGGPVRSAYARRVEVTPEDYGLWEDLGEGMVMWRLQVTSAGAVSMDLGFGEYFMPPSGSMFVYSVDGKCVAGPFTKRHNRGAGGLWTPVIESDDVVIEVTLSAREADILRLKLSYVNHGYRKTDGVAGGKSLGDAGWCNVNVSCPAGEGWRDQIRSVAKYYVRGPRGRFECTGTLVNNTAINGRPFFLTAFHCFDTSDEDPDNGIIENAASIARSVEVIWNYEAASCTQTTSVRTDTQTGAVYRAGYSDTDFVLVELDEMPPPEAEVYYAGWDRRSGAPGSGAAIHHASGDLKKISIDYDSLAVTSYYDTGTLPPDAYLRVDDWDVGTTEPGSSGCAFFNSAGRVVGQLHGGEAACNNDSSDWFGRFYRSWTGGGTSSTRLRDWLDPLDDPEQEFLFLDGKDGRPEVDQYEPDDEPELAAVIEPGVSQERNLLPVGDVDWVKFTLDRVSEVRIATSGTLGDTQMALYDGQMEAIDFNDDIGPTNLFSRIERVCGDGALLPGTYYIRIDEYNNDNTIYAYNLDLTVTGMTAGDFTGDCVADYEDLGVMASEWGRCATTEGGEVRADISGEGCVGVADVMLFAEQWLASGL